VASCSKVSDDLVLAMLEQIGLTSLAWTLVHLQYGAYELAIVFALGVLLGIVRLKTGSLWSCLFMHAFLNLVATIETALYVHYLIVTYQ
jgi:membrane protease YdiL (CAAX protease family)